MSALPANNLHMLSDPAKAAALLDPVRLKLVGALSAPDSAAGLARKLSLPRQKVNYHLRELERVGLVELVEERKKGNCTERLVRAVATSYLIDPRVLGELGPEPGKVRDHLSWAYLVSVAARAIRDLAVLRKRADDVDKQLPTITIESQIRFESQAALNAFTEDLAHTLAHLTIKYHARSTEKSRLFRFFFGAYPAITKSDEEAAAEAEQASAHKAST